jgi:tetratricopeptide (TPR) repeat protein
VRVLARTGRFSEAERVAKDIHSASTRATLFAGIARIAIQTGRNREAAVAARNAWAAVEEVGDYTQGYFEVFKYTPLALAIAGQTNDALTFLEKLRNSPDFLVLILYKATEAAIDANNLTAALDLARKARTVGERFGDTDVARGVLDTVYGIAAHFVRAGHVDEARALVEGLPLVDLPLDILYGANYFVVFAAELARTGHMAEAQRVLNRYRDRDDRGLAFGAAAEIVAHGGEADRAIELARHAADPSATLARVARALANAGSIVEAQQVIGRIADRHDQAIALYDLSQIALGEGQIEESVRLAERFLNVVYRVPDADNVFANPIAIATVTSFTGRRQIDSAWFVAQRIRYNHFRADAFDIIAEALIRAGNPRRALAAAREIKAITRRMRRDIMPPEMGPLINPRWLPRDIALSLARAGHVNEATTVAQGIIAPEWRAEALIASARAVATDRPAQALVIARQALAAANRVASRFTRDSLTGQVAQVLAHAGNIDEAVAVAKRVKDPQARARAIASIIDILARGGQMEAAKAVATRTTAYRSLASALAGTGAISEAIEMARRTEDISTRAETLLDVAHVLTRPPVNGER